MAGKWSDDWENPLADWLIEPSITNEEGVIKFTGMGFSASGNIGNLRANYRLQFKCGSTLSPEYTITVYSRIDTIKINPLSSKTIFLNQENKYDAVTFLTILDKFGGGVEGKIIDSIQVN